MVPVAAPVHRLSVEDVYRMVEAGVLHEHDRVELVEGVLVDMVPIGPEHDGALEWLNSRFTRAETEAWRVRVQSVLLTAGGYLLPDLLLVAPLPRTVQPSTAHLAIEVAQTSQARDLVKARDTRPPTSTSTGSSISPHERSPCIATRSPAPTRRRRPSPTAKRSPRYSPTHPPST